jgi:type IV pilus assembly protein PilM
MVSFLKSNSFVGVDIGSSSVKVVELKKRNSRLNLVTYGFTENKGEVLSGDSNSNVSYVAELINEIVDKSKVVGSVAIAALPTFSVFSSVISLSDVNKKEIESAVKWEAKKLIPLPLEEMVLDWKIIKEDSFSGGKNSKGRIKVLLTGAPKTLVRKYLDIFKEAKLNLLSLETETFSLIRSLLGNDKTTTMILELGTSTTDISIVKGGIPVINRSIDLGGMNITKAISKNLNIGTNRAEQFKYDLGISSQDSNNNVVPKIIVEAIDPVVNEVKHLLNLFQHNNSERVEKIVLSGGSALLPNFNNYLSEMLNINVIVGDPWSRVSYPVELEHLLKELGPRLSVAVGLAMRGIE